MMPLYDFECRDCNHKFEAFLKMKETPAALPCPECGAVNPRKLVAAFRTNAWSSFLDDMEKRVNPQKFK